jgi:hypothetical protein
VRVKPLPILCAFVLVIPAFGPVFGQDVIDDSLVLRFNFDAAPANDVIVDSSPAATHPGANKGATWVASENSRSGVMDFKAPIPNQIIVPAIPALNSSTGTISFWIKTPGNLVGGDFAAILVDRRTGVGDVITLTDGGQIFVQARGSGGGANSFSTAKVINDDAWHYVAYVYDQSASGSISIYVDGFLDANNANSQAWSWPVNQPLELGSSHDSYWRVFVGLMDDFQVHNRMLTADEVFDAYFGTPVLDSSLVERLNFTAAPVNDVVVDSSASNNSGTNRGAIWVSSDTGRDGLMRFALPVSQITVIPHPDFDSPTGTIAFWMKSTGNIGPGDFASMIFDRRADSRNGDVITMKDDGTIFWQAELNPPFTRANTGNTQARVNDGQWHHVAYVYDQSDTGSIRIYIDGVSSAFQTNSVAWAWPSAQELEFGLSHDGFWFGFNGALDDARIYNRMLSATEVGRIGVAPTFRFDLEPEGQTVFVGDDVTLTAGANMPAEYQWRHSGTNLPGQTNTTLVLSNVQPANAGSYTIVASNSSFGVITSTPAVLILNPRPSLTASLIARYNFDAAPIDDVVIDSAPGSRHPGTNRLATWVESVADRSGVMQFSGNDGSQIVVPPHPDFNVSKGAIAFWMKSAGNNGPGQFAAILFDRRTSNGDVITMVDDGTLFVQATSHDFRVNSFATTNMLNDDQWHHVAYVYDQGPNGFIRIYVDGQLAASNPNVSPWAWDPSQEIELGRSYDTFWRRFDGYLDDFQFYNRLLSGAEVVASMGPAISFSRTGNQLTLSWDVGGYILQENSDLINPNGWSDIFGPSPVTVTIAPTGNKYYRLQKF